MMMQTQHPSTAVPAPLSRTRKAWLFAAWAALYFGVPSVLAFAPAWIARTWGIQVRTWVILTLLLLAVAVLVPCAARGMVGWRTLFRLGVPAAQWRGMLMRWAVFFAVLTALLALHQPQMLFGFPRRSPRFWLFVMAAYPVLSVAAQGVLYRWFHEAVFAPLFGSPRRSLLAGALVFSYGHIVFHNLWAVFFTFIGGLLFLQTYRKSQSLLFSGIEHALYGDALFTIGWGAYFYGGTVTLLSQG